GAGTAARKRGDGGEQRGVDLLQHEQRDVDEGLAEVDAIPGADHVAAAAGDIPSQSNAGAEALLEIIWQAAGVGTVDRLELKVGTAFGLLRSTDQIVIAIPSQADVDRQIALHFPVILEIKAELFGCEVEIRIAGRGRHASYGARRGEALRIGGFVLDDRAR